MNGLRCIIVEDEPLAQRVLEKYIADHPRLILTKTCNNALNAFAVLGSQPVDVMFLDIKMPLINGMDFLRSLDNPPKVIITTAFAEYAAISYELEVVDYLLKPFTYQRFEKSINKLLKADETLLNEIKPGYIFIKVDGKLIKINHSDIIYIEAMKDYLKIFTTGKTYVTHMTMKSMEDLLPDNFIRVHRSYFISLSKATVISKKHININETRIPVGKLYKERIKDYLKSE